MNNIDVTIVAALRKSARQGNSVPEMYNHLKKQLLQDNTFHAVHVAHYFRQAFGLTFLETKPILALINAEDRSIDDENLLQSLVSPAIELHRNEWDR